MTDVLAGWHEVWPRKSVQKILGQWRCCMEHEELGTRPTRDGFQAVRWKLGRPSSVIRLRIRTPILASVFWFSKLRALSLCPMTAASGPSASQYGYADCVAG